LLSVFRCGWRGARPAGYIGLAIGSGSQNIRADSRYRKKGPTINSGLKFPIWHGWAAFSAGISARSFYNTLFFAGILGRRESVSRQALRKRGGTAL
jgi:hypothetical protein